MSRVEILHSFVARVLLYVSSKNSLFWGWQFCPVLPVCVWTVCDTQEATRYVAAMPIIETLISEKYIFAHCLSVGKMLMPNVGSPETCLPMRASCRLVQWEASIGVGNSCPCVLDSEQGGGDTGGDWVLWSSVWSKEVNYFTRTKFLPLKPFY